MTENAFAALERNDMPESQSGAGRLVPASALDFSRSSKNLAWLLEVPQHIAKKILAASYGFGDVHELQASIPSPGEAERATGPFDDPRERPPYFSNESIDRAYAENRLCRLTARERRLLRISLRILHQREEQDGRLRRRHYAILDGAFFSVPSIHRKKFADLKAGILAMEGTADQREQYLELNWPPAFWTYLEATQLLYVDSPGLNELSSSSIYFDEGYVQSFTDMFHKTAAHRAPAIFLAMAGEARERDDRLPGFEGYEEILGELPSITNGRPGLFGADSDDLWHELLDEFIPENAPEEFSSKLFAMQPHEIALTPPDGVPREVADLARKWRLHQLRTLSRQYVESDYAPRHFSRVAEVYWPGSAGPTLTETSELAFTLTRNAPSLMVYSEFAERFNDGEDENREFWSFKTLLTRTTPDEDEEVVGYMAGWLVVLASDHFVCDSEMLLEDVGYVDRMLVDGLEAFLKSYLPFNGFDDLLGFANSRWSNSVVITEIVLRDKFKKADIADRAFIGFTSAHEDSPFTDLHDNWLKLADFDVPTDEDFCMDPVTDVEIPPPGVFMVPVERQNKRLRKYLLSLSPRSDLALDNEQIDVFPFHFERPIEKSTGDDVD